MGDVTEILSRWGPRIIATLIGMIFMWLIRFLNPKYQFDKRLNYTFKIKNAISNLTISFECPDEITNDDIKSKLTEYLQSKDVQDVETQNKVKFQSLVSGTTYNITAEKDVEHDKNILLIYCSTPFTINKIGTIKGVDITFEELVTLTNKLNSIRRISTNTTVSISVTVKDRILFSKQLSDKIKSNKLSIEYSTNQFNTKSNSQNIKISSKEISKLKSNIENVFYEWMNTFL